MTTNRKFRKLPVIIEAFQYGKDPYPDWFMEAISSDTVIDYDHHAAITTKEGVMEANQGDWIIKGVQNELYPCKPSIFQQTYEEVLEVKPVGRPKHFTEERSGLPIPPEGAIR